MGVYLEDLTYKEILPILARTGKLIDTRKIIEIDLVRCGECKWCEEKWDSNNNCPTWECKNWFGGTDYDGFCHEGERRSES